MVMLWGLDIVRTQFGCLLLMIEQTTFVYFNYIPQEKFQKICQISAKDPLGCRDQQQKEKWCISGWVSSKIVVGSDAFTSEKLRAGIKEFWDSPWPVVDRAQAFRFCDNHAQFPAVPEFCDATSHMKRNVSVSCGTFLREKFGPPPLYAACWLQLTAHAPRCWFFITGYFFHEALKSRNHLRWKLCATLQILPLSSRVGFCKLNVTEYHQLLTWNLNKLPVSFLISRHVLCDFVCPELGSWLFRAKLIPAASRDCFLSQGPSSGKLLSTEIFTFAEDHHYASRSTPSIQWQKRLSLWNCCFAWHYLWHAQPIDHQRNAVAKCPVIQVSAGYQFPSAICVFCLLRVHLVSRCWDFWLDTCRPRWLFSHKGIYQQFLEPVTVSQEVSWCIFGVVCKLNFEEFAFVVKPHPVPDQSDNVVQAVFFWIVSPSWKISILSRNQFVPDTFWFTAPGTVIPARVFSSSELPQVHRYIAVLTVKVQIIQTFPLKEVRSSSDSDCFPEVHVHQHTHGHTSVNMSQSIRLRFPEKAEWVQLVVEAKRFWVTVVKLEEQYRISVWNLISVVQNENVVMSVSW